MKKVKFLALAVLIVFVLIGGAFAMWTDSIFIVGHVQTGHIDVVFVDFDYPEQQWHYSMFSDPGPDRDDFWKADLVAQYGYSEYVEVTTGDNPNDTWCVKLYNTIPELIVRKFVHVENHGSAPVVLDRIILTDDAGDTHVIGTHPANGFVVKDTELRFSLHDIDSISGDWEFVALGMELAPGQVREFAISVHTLPTAEQCEELDYTLELEWKLKDPSAP